MSNPVELSKSLLNFCHPKGASLEQRSQPFSDWVATRRKVQVWPYSKVLMDLALHTTAIANEFGHATTQSLNFASTDYLGMVEHPALAEAAHEAIATYGIHSAASPVLAGRTRVLLELENKLKQLFNREECMIFPTGWSAGFGVIAGLVRSSDTIIMDALAHNCLQEGAKHATPMVQKFRHNDVDHLEQLLRQARDQHSKNGLFVILESLYSMDSDSPNLPAMIQVAKQYDAIVIIDVAHDLGAMGDRGLGLLETVNVAEEPDIIMGSFSKTFATNGGFVACSQPVREYLNYYASPHIFSTAISPIQTAIASRSIDIIFSPEGDERRQKLMNNILAMRKAMTHRGLLVAGTPSPIVPVFAGSEKIARLSSKHLRDHHVIANLVEFPAVARNKARFRFQVMATHSEEAIQAAAQVMQQSKADAERDWHHLNAQARKVAV